MTNVQKIRNAYATKAEAQDVLQALQKLLRLYKTRSTKRGCPLCDLPGCADTCPWYIFTGGGCVDYRNEHFPKSDGFNYTATGYIFSTDQKAWRQLRMRQLPKWIFAYGQALRSW